MYLVAVMLSSYIDCKTVSFFLKISKEIGKAWRKSLARDTFCLTTRASLNTQNYGLFCSLRLTKLERFI